jgi:hypothetical protein
MLSLKIRWEIKEEYLVKMTYVRGACPCPSPPLAPPLTRFVFPATVLEILVGVP